MRSCNEMTELISAALDGELTSDERRELEEHLASCPACGALLAELNELHKTVGALEEAPEGFARQVMDQISAEGSREGGNVIPLPVKRRNRFHRKGWAATAAVVAVMILGVSVLPGRLNLSSADSSSDAASAPYAPNSAEVSGSSRTDAERVEIPSEFDASQSAPDTALENVRASGSGSLDLSNTENGWQEKPPVDPTSLPGTDVIGDMPAPALYCGVLVLTDGPLPEELAEYNAAEDEAGHLTYRIPADSFFAIAAELEEQNFSNFAYHEGDAEADPAAEYGLIIVETPSE